jgi:hypothetical protein
MGVFFVHFSGFNKCYWTLMLLFGSPKWMCVFSGAVSVSRRLGFWRFSFLFSVRRDLGLLGFLFGCVFSSSSSYFRSFFRVVSSFCGLFCGIFLFVSKGDFCVLHCLFSLIKK